MLEKQVEITVKGEVQGVNYRFYTQEKAVSLGLKGFVKNEQDGSVKIIARGRQKDLEKLVRWCKNGPMYASVEDVIVKYQESGATPATPERRSDGGQGEFNGFKIEY